MMQIAPDRGWPRLHLCPPRYSNNAGHHHHTKHGDEKTSGSRHARFSGNTLHALSDDAPLGDNASIDNSGQFVSTRPLERAQHRGRSDSVSGKEKGDDLGKTSRPMEVIQLR